MRSCSQLIGYFYRDLRTPGLIGSLGLLLQARLLKCRSAFQRAFSSGASHPYPPGPVSYPGRLTSDCLFNWHILFNDQSACLAFFGSSNSATCCSRKFASSFRSYCSNRFLSLRASRLTFSFLVPVRSILYRRSALVTEFFSGLSHPYQPGPWSCSGR